VFNIILALTAGILIGWNFHSFFISLNPPKILRDDFNLSSKMRTTPLKQTFIKESNLTTKKNLVPVTFDSLLNENLFLDVMRLYADANEEEKNIYRGTLQSFFEDKIYMNSKEAIVQLNEYLKLEPKNIQTHLQLVEAYKSLKEYDKALVVLRKLLENSNSAMEQEILNKEIIKNSKIYIDELNKAENFQQLIAFLEEQIEYGLNTAFYTFTLAKHYSNTKKAYPIAIKLLKEIEFDEKYGEKAKALLKKIEIIQTEKANYSYKFPLIKEGEHFLISVIIDEIPLKLLLDTGASYTLIDEDKLSSLTLLEDEITLQTPTGEMHSKLQQAQSFKIEKLELQEFKLVTTSFKQRSADGLLGMNFFKQFKFKIDQEEEMLYLSSK
jgi:predicted aspartyl protease